MKAFFAIVLLVGAAAPSVLGLRCFIGQEFKFDGKHQFGDGFQSEYCGLDGSYICAKIVIEGVIDGHPFKTQEAKCLSSDMKKAPEAYKNFPVNTCGPVTVDSKDFPPGLTPTATMCLCDKNNCNA